MERDKQMNRNRKKILQKWEKRRIRNRHKRYQRKEQVLAYILAGFVLAALIGGIAGQMILAGGILK